MPWSEPREFVRDEDMRFLFESNRSPNRICLTWDAIRSVWNRYRNGGIDFTYNDETYHVRGRRVYLGGRIVGHRMTRDPYPEESRDGATSVDEIIIWEERLEPMDPMIPGGFNYELPRIDSSMIGRMRMDWGNSLIRDAFPFVQTNESIDGFVRRLEETPVPYYNVHQVSLFNSTSVLPKFSPEEASDSQHVSNFIRGIEAANTYDLWKMVTRWYEYMEQQDEVEMYPDPHWDHSKHPDKLPLSVEIANKLIEETDKDFLIEKGRFQGKSAPDFNRLPEHARIAMAQEEYQLAMKTAEIEANAEELKRLGFSLIVNPVEKVWHQMIYFDREEQSD